MFIFGWRKQLWLEVLGNYDKSYSQRKQTTSRTVAPVTVEQIVPLLLLLLLLLPLLLSSIKSKGVAIEIIFGTKSDAN